MTNLHQIFIDVLEVSQIDSHVPYVGKRECRPSKPRMALVRAFIAKAVYNMPTTQILIDRLKSDLSLCSPTADIQLSPKLSFVLAL